MVSRIFFLIMLLSFSFPSKGKSEVSHTPNNPFSSLDKIKKEEIPPFVLASNPNKEQALRDETNRMRKIGNEIFLLKDTNPEKFVREFDQYLGHMGKLAKKYPQNTHIENLKNEIGSGYLMLGLFTRFELGRPKEAIHFFKKIPLFLGNGFSGFYLIADTYFYDLNNRRKALSYYKRTLSTLEKTTKNREFALWMEDWIRHEIDFVKTGKPFSGTIGREIATAPLSFLLIGSIGEKAGTLGLDLDIEIGELLGDQPTKQESFLKQLQRLPRSHISLSAALKYLPLFPSDKSLINFLEYHDPGRYWSATIFGLLKLQKQLEPKSPEKTYDLMEVFPATDQPGTLKSNSTAIELFSGKTGIRFNFDPDKRFITPEKTWNFYIKSLRKGDKDGVLSCFTPTMRSKIEDLFFKLSAKDMKEMAKSMGPLNLTKNGDYLVIRKIQGEDHAFFVYFSKAMGEWKIQSM